MSRYPPLIGQGVFRALTALILDRIFGRNGPRKFNHNAPTKRRAGLPNTPTEVRRRLSRNQARAASASAPNTAKTSGLRSGCGSTSRAAHTFPGVRDPCHLRFGVGCLAKARRQPAVDQVHERFQRFRIAAADRFAECMQRAGIGIWQLRKQFEHALAERQRRIVEQTERAAYAAFCGFRSLSKVWLVPVTASGAGQRAGDIVNLQGPEQQAAAAGADRWQFASGRVTDEQKSERCGGSSSTLSKALAPSR